MSQIPESLKYTKDHEWIRFGEDNTAIVGITYHAQENLGDITYVELPECGSTYVLGDAFGVVESVKAASDLFLPVDGEILDINELLLESPQLVNDDPYGDGWMVKIRIHGNEYPPELMTSGEYAKIVGIE